ncbi:MAG: DNA translocase FtsK 4TM domain-containing protein [Patescibacteria group bacterium]
MAKIAKVVPKIAPQLDVNTKLSIAIIGFLAAGILSYLSILRLAGTFGALVSEIMHLLVGRAAIILPLGFIFAAVVLYRVQKNNKLIGEINTRMTWGFIFMFSALVGWLSILNNIKDLGRAQYGGGIWGFTLYPWAFGSLGSIGGGFIFLCFAMIGFFLISQLTFVQFCENLQSSFRHPSKFWDLVPDVFEIWNGQPKSANPTNDEYYRKLNSFNDVLEKTKPKAKITDKLPKLIKPDSSFKTTEQPPKAIYNGFRWKFPPYDILHAGKNRVEAGDVEGNKNTIQETLSHFGIKVDMADTVTGPTVTQYTFKPNNGVKLSAIDSLQRDLALALAVNSLRLESPVAGQSLVGVQIPNKVKSPVWLKDLIQSHSFNQFSGDLPVVIGKDVAGRNLVYSLAKMPHLLVAGATGSGKSIWINSMLLSLLYRYTPLDLQLILVDMKRVELKLYEGTPHLVSNVITEAEKAINALKWTVLEMDRRYKLLEEHGKRNIKDYNEFAQTANLPEAQPIPYMVFVIDELGDLMMLAKSEVEPIIVRLTQMSRAVGIHMVLGTQRPDIHVVTGLIKANVPTRIAFAVASQVDSRVILDTAGAEKLLGQGDGLFMSPSNMQPVRFQGPLVEENEVRKCVQFLKDQAAKTEMHSNFDAGVTEVQKTKISIPGMSSGGSRSENKDNAFDDAKDLVIQYQKASTSFLQQMMGIGYPKAAKIMQQLEDAGVVGPANGSKSRDVYVSGE